VGTSSKIKRLGYISDHETKIDLLRNEAIAGTIINIILDGDDRPLTVGVHGYWGAGKSSVLEMIASRFPGQNDKTLVIRFNGWQFQGFEDAKIALIEGVVQDLIASRSFLTNTTEQVVNILKRIDWLKAARKVGGLAFNALTGMPSPDQVSDILGFIGSKVSGASSLLTKENAEAALGEAKEYWKDASGVPSVPVAIREFHQAFEDLLAKAGIEKLVVLVDDLDRCLPETAIQTLEAIRLFIMLPKTAFVIGADENMIQYAVTQHFPDLPEGAIAAEYPRAYLEKLIQIPFRIPTMGDAETRTYLTLLVVGALLGEDNPAFEKLLGAAKEVMSKPWEQKSLSVEDVSTSLENAYNPDIQAAVVLVDQIAPVLASGTSGNPRYVKRFVNAMNLRLRVADERGFGANIDPAVLAKVMLGEQFLPPGVFDQIAREIATTTDGKSPSIRDLESRLADGAPVEDSATDDTVKTPATTEKNTENPELAKWLVDSRITKWARVKPDLGDFTLKPYLFVINDVKNHVLSSAVLDPKLQALITKLCDGEFGAKSAVPGLKLLGPVELSQIFDDLNLRTLAVGDLQMKPTAFIGLQTFAEALPAFEERYLDVLDKLNTQNLGAWVVNGHEKIVRTENGKQRLTAIQQKWATSGNRILKGFSATAATIPKGAR
jgi:hypothetical protein